MFDNIDLCAAILTDAVDLMDGNLIACPDCWGGYIWQIDVSTGQCDICDQVYNLEG